MNPMISLYILLAQWRAQKSSKARSMKPRQMMAMMLEMSSELDVRGQSKRSKIDELNKGGRR